MVLAFRNASVSQEIQNLNPKKKWNQAQTKKPTHVEFMCYVIIGHLALASSFNPISDLIINP